MRIAKYFRTRVNRMIRVSEVRVIDDEGEQLGVMATDKALELAEEAGLDLVEVSPTAKPPVCRIIDYGKYKYEQNKRLKQSKKKQHVIQVKEIKLRPKIEEHDFQFKKRHAEEFLEKAHKVKFTVIFRGRELDHRELGARLLTRMEKELNHVGTVERAAMFEGRLMTMFMAPILKVVPKKPEKKEEQEEKAEQPEKGAKAKTAKKTEAKKTEAKETTDKTETTDEKEGTNAET